MSIAELKARAAKMNREREEQSAKDIEKRDMFLREQAASAEKVQKVTRLNVEWTVDLRTNSLLSMIDS